MVDVSDSEGLGAWLNRKPQEFTCVSRPARRYPIAGALEAKASQKGVHGAGDLMQPRRAFISRLVGPGPR